MYARTRSVLKKADADGVAAWHDSPIVLAADSELNLGLQLLRFEDMLNQSMVEYLPNLVTEYLFETAKLFASFYDQHKVIDLDSMDTTKSRLRLTDLTGITLRKGLELLGIGVVERM